MSNVRIVRGNGDAVTVVTNEGTKLKVRMYGIDAPEIQHANKRTGVVSKPGQPYGEEAYRALEGKVLHKRVKVQIMDIDRHRRMVAAVYLNSRDINREMVKEGYAWAYKEDLTHLSISTLRVRPGASISDSGGRPIPCHRGNLGKG